GQERLERALFLRTLLLARVLEFDVHAGRVGFGGLGGARRPDDLTPESQGLIHVGYPESEHEFGADGERPLRPDERPPTRDVAGVVRKKRVQAFVFDFELDGHPFRVATIMVTATHPPRVAGLSRHAQGHPRASRRVAFPSARGLPQSVEIRIQRRGSRAEMLTWGEVRNPYDVLELPSN